MVRVTAIAVMMSWMVACATVGETEDEHFIRDYLSDEEPNLHGIGISYEELGTLQDGDRIVIGVRNERCERRIEEGFFVGIDMQAYACNTSCRTYRAVSVYDRAVILPYHSIFRGITYNQLMSTPFINAEIYILRNGDTLSVPLWQIDAIVRVRK